jgi:2-desacetyl-2-hydroxyethyl bacteriochlorophyllide A dehydrogenase
MHMKALRIVSPRQFEIGEIDRPVAGPGQVLVRLLYASMCNQNDYKLFYGMYPGFGYPMPWGEFGHEGVGEVVEVGRDVQGLAPGDRVVLTGDGGGPNLYTEYIVREADWVIAIPRDRSPQQAAVLELFGCAYHGLQRSADLSGREVAVFGLGPAGLCLTQLARLRAPRQLIAVDLDQARCEAGLRAGATETVNASRDDELPRLFERGVDVAIDCTGVPASILNAFKVSRGEVTIFGFSMEPFQVVQSEWFHKELVIRNSKIMDHPDLVAVVGLWTQGLIDPGSMISRVMKFEQYAEAVELLYRQQAIKILLEW